MIDLPVFQADVTPAHNSVNNVTVDSVMVTSCDTITSHSTDVTRRSATAESNNHSSHLFISEEHTRCCARSGISMTHDRLV